MICISRQRREDENDIEELLAEQKKIYDRKKKKVNFDNVRMKQKSKGRDYSAKAITEKLYDDDEAVDDNEKEEDYDEEEDDEHEYNEEDLIPDDEDSYIRPSEASVMPPPVIYIFYSMSHIGS